MSCFLANRSISITLLAFEINAHSPRWLTVCPQETHRVRCKTSNRFDFRNLDTWYWSCQIWYRDDSVQIPLELVRNIQIDTDSRADMPVMPDIRNIRVSGTYSYSPGHLLNRSACRCSVQWRGRVPPCIGYLVACECYLRL